MTATVTASIASLILTIPVQTDYDTYEDDVPVGDAVIQDIATVKVWASTSTGFTPSDANLVYAGKSLTVVIANLTPLTTYYLKYALIAEADPTNIEYSDELSGTPNKIDGSIVVDGSITADQIAAGAVTTSKLSVSGRNMLTDVDSFEQYLGKEPTGASGSSTNSTSTDYAFHGRYSLKHVSTAINSYKYLNPTANDANAWVKLEVGKVYIVSAYVRTTSASATSVQFSAIPAEFGTTTLAGTQVTAALSIQASQGWQRISVVVANVTGTAPAMRFYVRNSSSGITSYWDGLQIEERIGTDNTPSPFTVGGTTVIDGGNIVANTITATQISATAVRGKLFSGNAYMDAGSTCSVTAALGGSAPADATTTVTLLDTNDFPPVGGFAIISLRKNAINSSAVADTIEIGRYTGKTSTTLTGVSGFTYNNQINEGDIVVPVTPLSVYYVAGDIATTGEIPTTNHCFRKAAGTKNAIAIVFPSGGSPVADFFTYTSPYDLSDQPVLTGISGLATYGATDELAIIDNAGFPTITVATTGAFTTATTQSGSQYIDAKGGNFILASVNDVVFDVEIISYSSTTVTFSTSISLTAGTYTIIPVQSISVTAAGLPLVAISTKLGKLKNTYIEDADITTNKISAKEISSYSTSNVVAFSAASTTIYPAISASSAALPYQSLPAYYDGIYSSTYAETFAGAYGFVYGDSTQFGYRPFIMQVDFDSGTSTALKSYFQTISTTLLFSDPETGVATDSITFDETNNTYNFNADGGSRNAYLQCYHIALGAATISTAVMANMQNSMSVNATRYGVYSELTITATTLTADRTLRAAYNSLILNYQNAAAFSPNAYACYNVAATGTSNGSSLDGEGQLYGCYNYALHQSDDATYKRIEEAMGSFNYVYSSGDTSLIDNAFGVYSYVRTGGTSASASVAVTNAYAIYGYVNAGSVNRNITTAYLLYLNSGETGTVTTKWGIYVNSTWPNFFNGNVILDGAVHYTPTVVTPVAAGTTTLTTSTSIVMCNHTATIATHTFAFPSTGLTNGQQITISSRSIITTVTLSGGTFRNAITTLAAGGFAQYTYSSTGAAWFRTA